MEVEETGGKVSQFLGFGQEVELCFLGVGVVFCRVVEVASAAA